MNKKEQNTSKSILHIRCWNILDCPMILLKYWNENNTGRNVLIPLETAITIIKETCCGNVDMFED